MNPLIFKGNRQEIYRIAKHIRKMFAKKFRCNGSLITDSRFAKGFLRKIVKSLKGEIIMKRQDDHETLIIYPDKKFTILLSPMNAMMKNDMDIAHCLGHFFLHCPKKLDDTIKFNANVSDKLEYQANCFAYAFLN